MAAGCTVTVRLAPEPPKVILAFGTRVGFEEVPDSVRLATGVSKSPTVNEMGPAALFSPVVWSAMPEIVGGSLMPVTVTVKVRLKVLLAACPSLTVTVRVADPLALVAGLNISVPVALGLV